MSHFGDLGLGSGAEWVEKVTHPTPTYLRNSQEGTGASNSFPISFLAA